MKKSKQVLDNKSLWNRIRVHLKQLLGGVPERLIGAVLKTVVRASVPWVRIPPPPPFKHLTIIEV